jgi:hypothetical protein
MSHRIHIESIINLIFTIQYQYETTEKAYKTPNITYWYSSFPQYDILAIPTPVESYIHKPATPILAYHT